MAKANLKGYRKRQRKIAAARAATEELTKPMDVEAALARVGVDMPKHLKPKREYHRDAIATLGISPQAREWEHLQSEYHEVKLRMFKKPSERVLTAQP